MRIAKQIVPTGYPLAKMQAVDVPINEVLLPDDAVIRPSHVAELAKSIDASGLLEPLLARKVKHQNNAIRLIGGFHRLEAMKRLEWPTVPCFVWDMNDDDAADMLLTSKVATRPLTKVEYGHLLNQQKILYERRHPETRHGVAGANAKHGVQTTNLAFTQVYAEIWKLKTRTIQRYIQFVEYMDTDELDFFLNLEDPITGDELEKFAQLLSETNGRKIRKEAIAQLKNGKAKTLKDAMKAVTPTKPKAKGEGYLSEEYLKLDKAWDRSKKWVQDLFLERYDLIPKPEPIEGPIEDDTYQIVETATLEEELKAVWDKAHDGQKHLFFDMIREELHPGTMLTKRSTIPKKG